MWTFCPSRLSSSCVWRNHFREPYLWWSIEISHVLVLPCFFLSWNRCADVATMQHRGKLHCNSTVRITLGLCLFAAKWSKPETFEMAKSTHCSLWFCFLWKLHAKRHANCTLCHSSHPLVFSWSKWNPNQQQPFPSWEFFACGLAISIVHMILVCVSEKLQFSQLSTIAFHPWNWNWICCTKTSS